MRDKYRLNEVMIFHNCLDLVAHFVLSHSSVCYAEADRHYLDSDDAYLILAASATVETRVQLGKKVDIWIQTNSNTVNEDNGSSGPRRMRAIPVGESSGW